MTYSSLNENLTTLLSNYYKKKYSYKDFAVEYFLDVKRLDLNLTLEKIRDLYYCETPERNGPYILKEINKGKEIENYLINLNIRIKNSPIEGLVFGNLRPAFRSNITGRNWTYNLEVPKFNEITSEIFSFYYEDIESIYKVKKCSQASNRFI